MDCKEHEQENPVKNGSHQLQPELHGQSNLVANDDIANVSNNDEGLEKNLTEDLRASFPSTLSLPPLHNPSEGGVVQNDEVSQDTSLNLSQETLVKYWDDPKMDSSVFEQLSNFPEDGKYVSVAVDDDSETLPGDKQQQQNQLSSSTTNPFPKPLFAPCPNDEKDKQRIEALDDQVDLVLEESSMSNRGSPPSTRCLKTSDDVDSEASNEQHASLPHDLDTSQDESAAKSSIDQPPTQGPSNQIELQMLNLGDEKTAKKNSQSAIDSNYAAQKDCSDQLASSNSSFCQEKTQLERKEEPNTNNEDASLSPSFRKKEISFVVSDPNMTRTNVEDTLISMISESPKEENVSIHMDWLNQEAEQHGQQGADHTINEGSETLAADQRVSRSDPSFPGKDFPERQTDENHARRIWTDFGSSGFWESKVAQIRTGAKLTWSHVTQGFVTRAALIAHSLAWALYLVPISAFVGAVCGVFLYGLEMCTQWRFQHNWLLFLLPIAGVLIAVVYKYLGGDAEKGNNLVLDEIYAPSRRSKKDRGSIPTRMAPLILFGALVTHLFGGSAGREGTAIQVAVSCISTYAGLLRRLGISFKREDTRIVLIAGIAAGFGGVFGTPMAATIFALEVLTVGKIQLDAILPALIASMTADWTGRLTLDAFGSQVDTYPTTCQRLDACPSLQLSHGIDFSWTIIGQAFLASIFFGVAASWYAWGMHMLPHFYEFLIPNPNRSIFHPVIGGIMIIILRYMVGTTDYLGIGVVSQDEEDGVSILSSFYENGAKPYSFLLKIIFTTVTLSSGFKGGEVTPLFFVGSTLGNAMANAFSVPSQQTSLFAAMGFSAVFGAATNTPISSFVLGVELFGGDHAIYMGFSCIVAYVASANSRIYTSQTLPADFKVVMKRLEHNRLFSVPFSPEARQ